MSRKQELAYVVLGYAPNTLADEVSNIGLILFDPEELETGYCKISFFPKWQSAVLRLNPKADIRILETLARDIERRLSTKRDRREMLHLIEDSFSNTIRSSNRIQFVTENDPNLELERLVKQLSPVPASS
jgi:hypothetical protein